MPCCNRRIYPNLEYHFAGGWGPDVRDPVPVRWKAHNHPTGESGGHSNQPPVHILVRYLEISKWRDFYLFHQGGVKWMVRVPPSQGEVPL